MNKSKKKIGISFTHTRFHHYWQWLAEQNPGGEFEFIQLSFEKNNVEDIPACDGFVLTGGVDVHPSFYNAGGDYRHAPDRFEAQRDAFEKTGHSSNTIVHLPAGFVNRYCRSFCIWRVYNHPY